MSLKRLASSSTGAPAPVDPRTFLPGGRATPSDDASGSDRRASGPAGEEKPAGGEEKPAALRSTEHRAPSAPALTASFSLSQGAGGGRGGGPLRGISKLTVFGAGEAGSGAGTAGGRSRATRFESQRKTLVLFAAPNPHVAQLTTVLCGGARAAEPGPAGAGAAARGGGKPAEAPQVTAALCRLTNLEGLGAGCLVRGGALLREQLRRPGRTGAGDGGSAAGAEDEMGEAGDEEDEADANDGVATGVVLVGFLADRLVFGG